MRWQKAARSSDGFATPLHVLEHLQVLFSGHAGGAHVAPDDVWPTSAYLGMTTGRAIPSFDMITWEPEMRSVLNPAAVKTLTKVRQSVGVILLTRFAQPMAAVPAPCVRSLGSRCCSRRA